MLFTKNLEIDGSVSYEPQETLAISEFKWSIEDPKTHKRIPMSMNMVFEKVRWQNSYDYFNFLPYLTAEQKAEISPRLFNTFSGYRWEFRQQSYTLPVKGGQPTVVVSECMPGDWLGTAIRSEKSECKQSQT